MKSFKFSLDETAVRDFFSPIRDKRSLLSLLIRAVKYMIVNPTIEPSAISGEMRLHIDKMSRLFFFTETRCFSFNFPFFVNESDSGYIFYSKHMEFLGSKSTSDLLSIIRTDRIHSSSCVLEFSGEFIDATEYSEELWKQFFELLRYEDGYIRFDHDPERSNGSLHPLNHFDIFYSNSATFKLGVNSLLSKEQIIDLLNIKSNCTFLV